jgi:hypothetical protein
MVFLIGFLIYWYVSKNVSAPDATSYLVMGLWCIAVVLLTYFTGLLWGRHVGGQRYMWVLFPGTLVHRVARAAGALALGCTVTNFRLYAQSPEDVAHSAPGGKVLGTFAVAVMPLFVALWAIACSSAALHEPVSTGSNVPIRANVSWSGARSYAGSAWGETKDTWRRVWSDTQFKDWRTFVFIYLLLVFTLMIAPRRPEVAVVCVGLAVLAGALFGAEQAGWSLLKYRWWMDTLRTMWRTLMLAVLAAEASFVLTLVVAGVTKLASRGGQAPGKSSKESKSSGDKK